MGSEQIKTISVSREDEFWILLKVYHLHEGYLFCNYAEEERVAFTLESLVERGFINPVDKHHPTIYGDGGARSYVSITDKGKKVIGKLIDYYGSLVR